MVPHAKLDLIVVDSDGSEALHAVPALRGQLHGYGEAVWIAQGQILRTSGRGYHPECFEPWTQELLARYNASIQVPAHEANQCP